MPIPAAAPDSTAPAASVAAPWTPPATLHEVATPAQAREVIAFAVRLYQGDPSYVQPLDQDIEAVFDPAKNRFFDHGQLTRWLLLDAGGQTIGRVAAFINERTARSFAQPTGGMGFFECIEAQPAADQLLGAARDWLAARGMAGMDGPINFGGRDQWWGLLLDNFGPPLYAQTYNPPYYQRLLETFGFAVYFKQYTYFRSLSEPFKPALTAIAERLLRSGRYTVAHLDLGQLAKFTEDFRQVYNQAWAQHDGVEEMTSQQAGSLLRKLRPVLDERLVWFAYHEGQPISFFVSLPELNELFRYVGGQLNWLGKAKFAWYRWRGVGRTVTGIAFGVVPAFQRRGVEAAMIMACARQLTEHTAYQQFVMNWIGDFNPGMMAVATQIGGRIWRTHATYRYLFDRAQPFERAPIL